MSIWSSIPDDHDIVALDCHNGAANYRAEGEPTIDVDVATTGHHNHVRLALYSKDGMDTCALLSPDSVRVLRDRLTVALGEQPMPGA